MERRIKRLVLVEHSDAVSVLVRINEDGDLQVNRPGKKGKFSLEDEDDWERIDQVTVEDIPHLEEVIRALGDKPKHIMQGIKIVSSY